MGRRPRIKVCEHTGCKITFTGRGRYCERHRAPRGKINTWRQDRNRESQRNRRDAEWARRYTGTGTSSPVHEAAGQRGSKSRGGPLPIDATGTPGMTAARAIRIFMSEWRAWRDGAP